MPVLPTRLAIWYTDLSMHGSLAYLVFKAYPQGEIVVTALAVLVALLPFGGGMLMRLSAAMESLGSRPRICGLTLFVVSFALVSLLALRRGAPLPYVHDEFSYLLAADTFAHGRLTNPTPPAWEHFESMHILVRPSYQSKYPPAQGLVMALGQVVFGQPIAGVWLSTAGAVLAGWWALRAFIPARWALAGGIIMAIHPQVLEWGQRYWGGNIALGAGAMVLGAAARFIRPSSGVAGEAGRMWASLIGGAGIVLLAWSRPFEGAVFTGLVFLWAAWQWSRRPRRLGDQPSNPTATARTLAPLALVVLAGLAWLGYYNHRVTGSALRLAYTEHHSQYGSAPLFIFQPAKPVEEWPKYRNPQMLQFARDQHYDHARRRKLDTEGWTRAAVSDLFLGDKGVANALSGMFLTAFGNVATLALALVVLPYALKADRRLRRLAVLLAVFAVVLLLETYMHGHYLAPAGTLVLLILLIATRWMWRFGGPGGRMVVRCGMSMALVGCVFWWIGFHGWKQQPADWRETRKPWFAWRNYIANDFLAGQPGPQLAIVRYAPSHFVHEEWVYNGADLQTAKVIWARDLGDQANRNLLDAFPGRQAWLVEPDGERIEPIPYTLPKP